MTDWNSRLSTILKDYNPKDIFNADETGMFYRLQPDKILEFKSKDCHGGKQSEERLTAMVCADMSGTEKLPMFVIGKSAQPRCFKNVKSLPTTYKDNKKSMDDFRNFHRMGTQVRLGYDSKPEISRVNCGQLSSASKD
ncbi:tigger transposable element-derived protein 6-like [Mercenaria mercenaria]|uniref:tigger transposable element-derived protein 6-like n=1 Tax=Mercenaria mercenaria TaxID=6596 RepID=UPI00234EB53E|nr:tigger transposable element-derived protein 6-like [Mercenaria mercenaria]